MNKPDYLADYLSPSDVAAALKVSRRTVYEWLLTGKLVAYRPAGRYLITREQLNAFVMRPYAAHVAAVAEKAATVAAEPVQLQNPLSNLKNKSRGSK